MSASGDDVTVQIRANVDELTSGLNDALSALTASFEKLDAAVKQSANGLQSQLGGGAKEATTNLEHVKHESINVGEAVESMHHKLTAAFQATGILVLYEALEKIVEKLDEVGEHAEHLIHTSMMFGITTKELQGLDAIAIKNGASAERLERAMMILQIRMTSAAEQGGELEKKLNNVGISTANLHNPAFTAADAMVAISRSGASMGEMMALLGARNAAVIPTINALKGGLGAAGAAAEEVNSLTREQIDVLAEAKEEIEVMNLQWENFTARLVAGVSPAIVELLSNLREIAGAARPMGDIFHFIGQAIKEAVVVVVALLYAFMGAVNAIVAGAAMIWNAIKGVGTILKDVFTLHFAQAADDSKRMLARMKDDWRDLVENIDKDAAVGELGVKRLWRAMNDSGDPAGHSRLKGAGEEERPAPGRPTQRTKPPESDAMAEDLKLQYSLAQTGSLQRVQIAMQLSERLKAVYGEDSKQFREGLKMQAQASKEYGDQQVKLQEDALSASRAAALDEVAFKEEQLKALMKGQQVTIADAYAQEQGLLQQKLAINRDYYEQLKMLRAGNEMDEQQVAEQLAAAAREHNLAVLQSTNSMADQMRQRWNDLLAPISQAFEQSINGMIAGTLRFGDAMRKIGQSVLLEFVNLSVKMLTKWVATEIAKTQASTVGAAVRTATEEVSAKKSVASTAGAAIKQIAIHAYTAMAAVYQSVAAIPYVGWILAPIAAIAAGAAVFSFAKSIASARGGFEVPSDQIAQLHKDEMVLPAQLSTGIKSMIASGQVGGGPGGGGGNGDVHLHVAALDARSIKRLFQTEGAALADALRTQKSRFNSAMRPT